MELTRIYKLIPYLLIVLALGAIAFLLITGNTALLIKSPIFILLAFIIGSLFIILTKKHHSESVNVNKIANLNLPQRTLRRIFVIVGALMMITVLLGLKDSVIYIVLLVILAVCIILQILSKNVSAPWVIGELLYVVGMLVFPFVFAYEYYYDGSDLIYHTYYTNTIIETGHLDLFASDGSIYSAFPGLHLSTATTSFLTALPTNVSLYVFLTLVFLGLSMFAYLISKEFFPSVTIALLALYIVLIPAVGSNALISFAPYALLCYLALMVLFLIFYKSESIKLQILILAIPIILSCLLTHHANQFPILAIFLFLIIVDILIVHFFSPTRKIQKKVVNLSIILLYCLICGIYIIYLYLNSMIYLLSNIFAIPDGEEIASSVITSMSNTIDPFSVVTQILTSSNSWLCIIPALVGMYILIINKKSSRKQYVLGFFMLIFFILFVNISSGIPMLNGFKLFRFYNLIWVIFAGGIAFGLCYIVSKIKINDSKKYIGKLIVGIFCIFLLTTPILTFAAENTVLSPLNIVSKNPDNSANNHFSSSEYTMIQKINSIIPTGSSYISDSTVTRYLLYESPKSKSSSISLLFSNSELKQSDTNQYPYIFFRNEHLKDRGFSVSLETISGNINSVISVYIHADDETMNIFTKNTQNHNIIYTNGGSTIYAI